MKTIPWTIRAAALLCVPVLGLAGCAGDETPPCCVNPSLLASPAVPQALGPADAALVGSWTGRILGPSGSSPFTMTLGADASMSAEGTGNYCRVTGTWGVSGGVFTARGPECRDAVATFTAPSAPGRLAGTWTATNGARGSFEVSR
jgi:hypothetical protein